jgi:NADPH-dependent curcumin reductase CurA
MATNLAIHLAKRPTGEIIPGTTFTHKTTPAPTAADLKDGQILVEVLYLSLDPALRPQLDGKLLPLSFPLQGFVCVQSC